MQTKKKATMALLISALGTAMTLPTAGAGFVSGLVHHGFLAATIGGLADWFAVTALFRKPLGIGYRTEILRRNRDRIMDSIVEFTSEDLLSVENIMSVLRKEDTAGLLVEYLIHRGGREHIRQLVDELLLKAVNSMDTSAVANKFSPAIRKGLSDFAVERVFLDMIQLLSEEKHSRRVLASFLHMGEQVLHAPTMQQALIENIRVLRRAYEGESAGRAFVLAVMDLDDEHILSIFNERMTKYLDELLRENTEAYVAFKNSFELFLRNAAEDPSLANLFRGWREHYLEHMDISEHLGGWLEKNVKGEHPFWIEPLNHFLDARIEDFVRDKEMQRVCDRYIKNFLEGELRKHHDMIQSLIRERLNDFDDTAPTEFFKSKVADDLQMIRINGSIVGGLVGILLYVIVQLSERVWGL